MVISMEETFGPTAQTSTACLSEVKWWQEKAVTFYMDQSLDQLTDQKLRNSET